MFCPKCHAEYIPGFTRCSDCDVALVDSLPQAASAGKAKEPKRDYRSSTPADLVTVLSAGDAGLIAVAKSVLQSADIPFLVQGEAVQDLFGAGRLGTGFSLVIGPIAIQVRAEDAAEAREILTELREDHEVEPG